MRATTQAALLLACLLWPACSSTTPRGGSTPDTPRSDDAGTDDDAGAVADDGDVAPTATDDESPFEVPDRQENDGAHHITISREYSDAARAQLIVQAEELCPDQNAVRLALAARAADVSGLWEEDCVWWMGARGGLRIPYAVTDDALAYYVARIEAFRDGDFAATPEGDVETSRLSYSAEVEHHELFVHDGRRFLDAHVVRMELSWTHFCAGPCAFGFTLIRHVIFVPDEDPIAMNDGSPAVW